MQAEALYRHALRGRQKALGRDHAHTWITLNALACLLDCQGKLTEDDPIFQRIVQARIPAVTPSSAASAARQQASAMREDSRGAEGLAECPEDITVTVSSAVDFDDCPGSAAEQQPPRAPSPSRGTGSRTASPLFGNAQARIGRSNSSNSSNSSRASRGPRPSPLDLHTAAMPSSTSPGARPQGPPLHSLSSLFGDGPEDGRPSESADPPHTQGGGGQAVAAVMQNATVRATLQPPPPLDSGSSMLPLHSSSSTEVTAQRFGHAAFPRAAMPAATARPTRPQAPPMHSSSSLMGDSKLSLLSESFDEQRRPPFMADALVAELLQEEEARCTGTGGRIPTLPSSRASSVVATTDADSRCVPRRPASPACSAGTLPGQPGGSESPSRHKNSEPGHAIVSSQRDLRCQDGFLSCWHMFSARFASRRHW